MSTLHLESQQLDVDAAKASQYVGTVQWILSPSTAFFCGSETVVLLCGDMVAATALRLWAGFVDDI